MCDVPDMINAIVILSAGAPFAEIVVAFENLGFELTKLIDTNGFLIAGEISLFNSVFSIELLLHESGGAFYLDANGLKNIRLPIEQFSEHVRPHVDAIELQQPIEFGPVDY